PAEKRHSEFQGAFKWFINELADRHSPLLEQYGILTAKQMLRMADAELLTELAIVLDSGIVNRDGRSMVRMYRHYDEEMVNQQQWEMAIESFFAALVGELAPLRDTFMMKSYVIHSLFCAMT